jgi:ribonuclease-3
MPSADSTLDPARHRELEVLAESIGYSFRDPSRLQRALCHASTGNDGKESYERLEFLGDAILGFLVAERLFHHQPEIPEGELTDLRSRLVAREPLAKLSRDLDLGRFIESGRGFQERDRTSPRILADLVEAVLAAIYLDGGLEAAVAFVERHVMPRLAQARLPHDNLRDPKSRLLHFAQTNHLGQPVYEVIATDGPAHERHFEVVVVVGTERVAAAWGRSKQAAEKVAAEHALTALKARKDAAPGS